MRRWSYLVIAIAVAAIGTGFARAQAPAKAPDTVVLKGAPMGGVKLDHAKHAKLSGAKCTDCHHASKPEKPLKSAQQKCADCHTKVAAAPMKTKYQNAFHDGTAKKGTCVDCHAKAISGGNAKAPAKCTDCHKKENGI
jgi:hypothetical protein